MKFFKFLAIAFPIYVAFILIVETIDSQMIPEFIDSILQILALPLLLTTLPFTPLLKALGMYVVAFWSFPTTNGVIFSAVIWEIIFLFLFWWFKKKSRSISKSIN